MSTMHKSACMILALVGALLLLGAGSHAQELDRVTGLVMTQGWQAVQANCTECHSTQLIIQNSGSREVWKSRLVWMQETQGLHQLEPALENEILDYLTANYGQKQSGRRAGLPPGLLPPNPYESTN